MLWIKTSKIHSISVVDQSIVLLINFYYLKEILKVFYIFYGLLHLISFIADEIARSCNQIFITKLMIFTKKKKLIGIRSSSPLY